MFNIDPNNWILVLALCACAAYLFKEALGDPILAAIALPAFLIGARMADIVFVDWGVGPTADRALNLTIASGAGIVLTFLLLVLIYWAIALRSSRRA